MEAELGSNGALADTGSFQKLVGEKKRNGSEPEVDPVGPVVPDVPVVPDDPDELEVPVDPVVPPELVVPPEPDNAAVPAEVVVVVVVLGDVDPLELPPSLDRRCLAVVALDFFAHARRAACRIAWCALRGRQFRYDDLRPA